LKIFQEWGIKENGGGGEFKYDILKEFYRCHSVPQHSNKKEEKKGI
jgi:hypothetical protein